MSESPEWHGTCEDVRSVGNRIAEVGLEYFCPDYVSKNGVSVTECNIGIDNVYLLYVISGVGNTIKLLNIEAGAQLDI